MPDPAYVALTGLIRVVRAVGRRSWRDVGPLLEPHRFPWLGALTESGAEIRREADALLARFAPADSRSLTDLSVGVRGSWRLVPLVDRIGRYPYVDRLPATVAALSRVPRLRAADLALLTAHSRIQPHCGDNWGVLRAHLTLIEPEGDAVCALRFPERSVQAPWRRGESFVFDDTYQHEAVNERTGDRLVLLVEFDRPLPPMVAWLNACSQRLYSHHPVQRGVRERVLARYRAEVAVTG